MKKVYLLLLLCVCIQLNWGQDRVTEIRNTSLSGSTPQLLVVTHHVDWRNAPEDSLQGIQNCIDTGADMVEIGLKKARGGHLVPMHDKLINRIMNGKGHPKDYTLVELKVPRLKNGTGCKTRYQVLTSKEVTILYKGKIMVDTDKDYNYLRKAYVTLEKTSTAGQYAVKISLSYEQVKSENGGVLDKMIFMPAVNLQRADTEAVIGSYLMYMSPKAFELMFNNDGSEVLRLIDKARSNGARIFINSP